MPGESPCRSVRRASDLVQTPKGPEKGRYLEQRLFGDQAEYRGCWSCVFPKSSCGSFDSGRRGDLRSR